MKRRRAATSVSQAKQKKDYFFDRRGVFCLTCPLMGDPFFVSDGVAHRIIRGEEGIGNTQR